MLTLSGAAIAEGVALGPAVVLRPTQTDFELPDKLQRDPQNEIDFFLKKLKTFTQRLNEIATPAPDQIRDSFGATVGFLKNKHNQAQVIGLIQTGCPCAVASHRILLQNLNAFYSCDDEDSNADRREIYNLVLEFIASLRDQSSTKLNELPQINSECVLIAKDLTPATFLSLRYDLIKAVVLEGGHSSNHLSTIMRELGIPSVFGVLGASTNISEHQQILVDANMGVVLVDPPQSSTQAIIQAHDLVTDLDAYDDSLLNITLSCSVGAIRQDGLNPRFSKYGLGLLRSEFLFLSKDSEPDEEEMLQTFTRVFTPIPDQAPIFARTFDFAEDKKPNFAISTDDSGPLKDYGACVDTRLLRKELRALLQAGAKRKITIVFPLVTRVSESKYLSQLARDCALELDKQQMPRAEFEIALMIETPAAVLSEKAFADHCSMFVIGTSSLAEYAAAPRKADLSFTPALAKMIVMAAKTAAEAKVPIGIAGRYASHIELLPFYYALGATHITVNGYQIPKLRAAIEKLNIENITPQFDERVYAQVMDLFTGQELSKLIDSFNFRS